MTNAEGVDSLSAMFESFKEVVDRDRTLKEEIAEVAHEMECGVLKVMALLQKTHTFLSGDVKVDPNTGFHLDVEDYLFGVLQLASELSRFSVSAVIAGNNMLPLKITDFLYDLDAKFRLLNLKNDALRRRYDVLKYDIQRTEQVVYDLAIRGLKPPPDEKLTTA